MKRILLLVSIIALASFAHAQINRKIPKWVTDPIYLDGNKSKVITKLNIFGVDQTEVKEKLRQAIKEEYSDFRIIDQYWTNSSDNNWTYGSFLVQVCKGSNCTNWEHVEMETTKYPFSARCFVPGMAQIYKGSKVKGGLIIGGEVLGVAGIVTCFGMKAQNERWLQESKKASDIQYYSDRADMWQNIGYGAIAFTAAIYIYNVIDGAIAPGQKHIQIGSKSYNYALAPMVTTRGDLGLAMRVNF